MAVIHCSLLMLLSMWGLRKYGTLNMVPHIVGFRYKRTPHEVPLISEAPMSLRRTSMATMTVISLDLRRQVFLGWIADTVPWDMLCRQNPESLNLLSSVLGAVSSSPELPRN